MKKKVKQLFDLTGYGIHRISKAKSRYSPHYPYHYVTYSPWFEPEFLTIYEQVRDRTVVTEDRCYTLAALCGSTNHLAGDVAECGVFKGGTAYLLARTITDAAPSKQLHLLDTFEGMPQLANQDESGHQQGDFGGTTLEGVREFLRTFNCVTFHPGMMPDTFHSLEGSRFSFVHVDVDLYETGKECCKFFYERLVEGGIMLFDDYGFPKYQHAIKKGVDEFFKDKPEPVIVLPTGQSFVIKAS